MRITRTAISWLVAHLDRRALAVIIGMAEMLDAFAAAGVGDWREASINLCVALLLLCVFSQPDKTSSR
jgi:hypothetical protein